MTNRPYHKDLGDGLVLRPLTDADHAERLIAFNDRIFGHGVGPMTRAFIDNHPAIPPDYWLTIEHNGAIISSLVLIPSEWRYESVTIRTAEMGIVGTDEAWRRRGLVRILDAQFKELLHRDGFHLSHIQGIPNFYRQFGYEYALPLEAQWQIELRALTSLSSDAALTLRRAGADDIAQVIDFASAEDTRFDLSAVRTPDLWRYLILHSAGTATEAETWMITRANKDIGTCRIALQGFGDGLIVAEASPLDLAAADGLLAWLRTLAVERGKPYIRFNLPESNTLLQVARAYGAYDAGMYQFQLYVPDPARLIRQIVPVLNRRIADSLLRHSSTQLLINLYRSALRLNIEAGRIQSVEAIPPQDAQIAIPPGLFAALVLGFRSRTELATAAPDFSAWGHGQVWCDVLFPQIQGWIYPIY